MQVPLEALAPKALARKSFFVYQSVYSVSKPNPRAAGGTCIEDLAPEAKGLLRDFEIGPFQNLQVSLRAIPDVFLQ